MASTPDRLVYRVESKSAATGLIDAVGDSTRLDVSRSVLVGEDDPLMLPVKLFVADHGLVRLPISRKYECTTAMLGEALHDRYELPDRYSGENWPDVLDIDDWWDILDAESIPADERDEIDMWVTAVLNAAVRLGEQTD